MDELAGLVQHLSAKVGRPEGRQAQRAMGLVQSRTSPSSLSGFRQLNPRSNDQLDDQVGQCQQIVGGVGPQRLRDNQVLRQSVVQELSEVQAVLDGLLVDRPRRNILRRPK